MRDKVSLAPFTTLRAGGCAERFIYARTGDELAEAAILAQVKGWPLLVLGAGSNVLPSDHGIHGLTIINGARTISWSESGFAECDSGVPLQELFLKCAQRGLGGLEHAVGIPGTVGGALVSNAGAYRSNVSAYLTELEIAIDGQRQWVSPEWMEFSYRDSKLRRPDAPVCAILRLRMRFPKRAMREIYNEAREYQQQRISKQPAPASAGSFFKNVVDHQLAQEVDGLTDGMRANGVIPSGFLIEAVGLKGARHGGAMLSKRHANFMLNAGAATATEIYELAQIAKQAVFHKFGVTLEEEVLYLGDWSGK
ncbi:MAG: UDP-N-acetylmuramate dehydrogenase [Fimbriimonadaceae bacterium]|nr:UDP-N-acetylmuramate dehydrogenase [Fimbriimonadaceae bacterium]